MKNTWCVNIDTTVDQNDAVQHREYGSRGGGCEQLGESDREPDPTLDGSHYLQIELEGEGANTAAIGAKATLYTHAGLQYAELALRRGFQSSVEPMLHFGLGSSRIDSLVLRWPDGTWTRITDVAPDQRLRVRSAAVLHERRDQRPAPTWFTESAGALGLGFAHKESEYDDLRVETLLPHRQSQHGPGIALADVNKDGRDDLFVSAAAGASSALWLQSSGERFEKAINHSFHL